MDIKFKIQTLSLKIYLNDIFNFMKDSLSKNNYKTIIIENSNNLILKINNEIKEYVLYNKLLNFFDLIDILNNLGIETKVFESIDNKYIYSEYNTKNITLIDNNNKILDNNRLNNVIHQYHNLSIIKRDYSNIKELDNLYCFHFFGSFIFHYWIMAILPLFIELKNNNNELKNIYLDENYKDLFFELCKIFEIEEKNINIIYAINEKIKYKQYCYKVKKLYIPLNISTDTTIYNYVILRYLHYYYSLKINPDNNNKVFIERNYLDQNILANTRQIINKQEIKDLLLKNNYKIFQFEKLSFKEKFQKIANAEIIIVEAGSTLVNLYFCLNKNTKIIILNSYGNYHNHGHTTVRQPAQFFNNIINIIGDTQNKDDIQSTFKINLQGLLQYI